MMVGRAEEKTNEYGCLLLVCKARFTDYLWEKKKLKNLFQLDMNYYYFWRSFFFLVLQPALILGKIHFFSFVWKTTLSKISNAHPTHKNGKIVRLVWNALETEKNVFFVSPPPQTSIFLGNFLVLQPALILGKIHFFSFVWKTTLSKISNAHPTHKNGKIARLVWNALETEKNVFFVFPPPKRVFFWVIFWCFSLPWFWEKFIFFLLSEKRLYPKLAMLILPTKMEK